MEGEQILIMPMFVVMHNNFMLLRFYTVFLIVQILLVFFFYFFLRNTLMKLEIILCYASNCNHFMHQIINMFSHK